MMLIDAKRNKLVHIVATANVVEDAAHKAVPVRGNIAELLNERVVDLSPESIKN